MTLLDNILNWEKYIPVMTPYQQYRFACCIRQGMALDFTPEEVQRFSDQLEKKNQETEARFASAIKRSRSKKEK